MPRLARLVIPGVPHHITQRGNRRQRVFFSNDDKALYIKILKDQGAKKGLQFWSYCLMDNHVHLICVPKLPDSLSLGIGETHRRFTTIINARENWGGYLWQGRFHSCPLDEWHLILAARYIEQNPVRAGIVKKPEDFQWSSARAGVTKTRDGLISENNPLASQKNWRILLKEALSENDLDLIRKHSRTGRPLGSEEFIRRLERTTGRLLMIQKPGRKPWK